MQISNKYTNALSRNSGMQKSFVQPLGEQRHGASKIWRRGIRLYFHQFLYGSRYSKSVHAIVIQVRKRPLKKKLESKEIYRKP